MLSILVIPSSRRHLPRVLSASRLLDSRIDIRAPFVFAQSGYVHRWDLQNGARVDDCVALNRAHSYHAMELKLSDKREVRTLLFVGLGRLSCIRRTSIAYRYYGTCTSLFKSSCARHS